MLALMCFFFRCDLDSTHMINFSWSCWPGISTFLIRHCILLPVAPAVILSCAAILSAVDPSAMMSMRNSTCNRLRTGMLCRSLGSHPSVPADNIFLCHDLSLLVLFPPYVRTVVAFILYELFAIYFIGVYDMIGFVGAILLCHRSSLVLIT